MAVNELRICYAILIKGALLTGDGMANLLQGLTQVADPRVIVDRLMVGVDSYSGS